MYPEGDQRISLRDKIFRELVANIIAHREYLDGHPATIIIYKDKVVFSNPNIPHGRGVIDPKHFTPFSKNPTICKFMLQTGRIEEVGSGIRNVSKYLPLYSRRGKFEFIEDDMFVTKVYLDELAGEVTPQVTPQATPQVTPQVRKLLLICDGDMTKKQLMNALNLKDREYLRIDILKPALENKFVEMTIPDKPNHPNQKYRLTEKGKSLKKNEIKLGER